MSFRKRVLLMFLLPILLAAAVGVLYLRSAAGIGKERRGYEAARAISGEIVKLNFVSDRYLIYRQRSILEEWFRLHRGVEAQLRSVRGENRTEEALLEGMRANLDKLNRIIAFMQGALPGEPALQVERDLEKRLLEAMVLRSRAVYSDAVRLEKLTRMELERLSGAMMRQTVAGIVLTILGIMAAAVILGRRIISSVTILRDGTEKVASGNLDVEVVNGTADELGALAGSFNSMTRALKKERLYLENMLKASEIEVSLYKRIEEDLRRENEERVRAEEALRAMNAQLEEKVRERTAEVVKSRDLLEGMKEHADRMSYQARLAAETHREHHARLNRMIERSRSIFSCDTLDELHRQLVFLARELLKTRHAVLGHEPFEQGTSLVWEKSEGSPPCSAQPGSPLRRGVCSELLSAGRPRILSDIELRDHPLWRGLPPSHPELRGLLAAPVFGEGGTVAAMLMVTDRIDGREFDQEDQVVLAQLAALGSVAADCMKKPEKTL